MQRGNDYYNWIGLQIRNSDGNLKRSSHLTADSIIATHPVLMPVDANNLLVAYTVKAKDKNEVWYKLVSIE